MDSVDSGWVRPAPKRDRRLPSLRGLFSEVVALGVVELVVGGFLRKDWRAGGSCGCVVSGVASATLEEEATLSDAAAGLRRRGGRGSDAAPTPFSLGML